MDISMTSKGTPKQNPFVWATRKREVETPFQEDYTDDLDDEMSNGSGSDEDDWGAKRKKGKNASSKKKKASGAAGRPRESHACSSECSVRPAVPFRAIPSSLTIVYWRWRARGSR